MPLEALRTISEAEEAARRMKADAAAKAKQMLSDAEKVGEASLLSARDQAEQELAAKRLAQKELADEKAAEYSRLLEEQKSGLRSMAQSRLEEAAGAIVERIVNG